MESAGQGSLFAGASLDPPKQGTIQWTIRISGRRVVVYAASKREAFADAASAVRPLEGRGIERRYRLALQMGAKVISKTPIIV
ncbi:MAG: hypothetical protein COT24_04085 [Candidatus Kerfeldbacteria bacterium CG08_land_8_20_14_0_20_40_16]|uniref:Uncharacterized protein n=1 Tax=Candidatus Kerfeldbacteria bacterium CG08_land_8_20_14_0_20_40_16 TaxID=2014244 RepID=A0A2H0YVQ3_9BACT|nr:MAG: hypothetical protein COT24_04085 [Candidatus Kerfeldbacteria bacterium CG08_land_8_20_14_0_20_40_16]